MIKALKGLDKNARLAWDRMLNSAGDLSAADTLALEAAARSWSRWKVLEERIAEFPGLDGEIAAGANGEQRVSALRKPANDAFWSFLDIAEQYGLSRRALTARWKPRTSYVDAANIRRRTCGITGSCISSSWR